MDAPLAGAVPHQRPAVLCRRAERRRSSTGAASCVAGSVRARMLSSAPLPTSRGALRDVAGGLGDTVRRLLGGLASRTVWASGHHRHGPRWAPDAAPCVG